MDIWCEIKEYTILLRIETAVRNSRYSKSVTKKYIVLERGVDKDTNDLHLIPNDAMSCCKWREMIEGIGVTAMTVMP